MARLVTVVLQRVDDSVPWGFRIQGGADYNQPLSVQRVTPGALASQQLDPGDILIMIEGQDARLMCHFDAYELIKMAGNTVELIVRKANSKHLCAENLVQQEKLEQTVVEERYKQEEEKLRRKALKDSRSPPFSSGSSGHSHSARSPPARGLSPQEVPVSPTVGATALPINTMPQVSQMGNNENSSYSSTHFPFQKFDGQQISGVPAHTQLQSQIRQIMSPKIRTFIPITSPTQRFSSELQPLSPPIHQPLRNTFSLSPPVRPASQRFFPISPPTLPPISKPYTSSPSVRQSNTEKLYRNSDSRKLTTFQTINTQENVECYTIEQSEAMPMPTTLTPHQSQKTRSQTVSSVQQMSRENIDMIKTSSQNITSSPNTINVYRRTSCSPQRIIPPLPKTIFSDDKPISQNKYTGEFQRSQSTQEFDTTYQTTHFVDNLRRSSLKNDTPNRSLRLFSPKPFSPPSYEADVQQTLSSPPVVTATSNFSTPLRMFSPHHLPNQQQIQNHAEINPQALSKKLQALAQSEDLASSSSQGSGAYASVDPLGIERRSISQEREPMTMEEYKQRQLQKLIEEKVRLEEMMMIAKRRQSLSESHESSMKKKENKVLSISTTDSCNAREISEQALELEPMIKNIDTQNNLQSTKSEGFSSPSSLSLVENKTQALREKEEESRLRKENQIRDEKIRRMQERRYEEKLKKNSLKTSRDRSCPPDPKLELNSQTDLKELGDRKSRERSRVIQKDKIVRDRSCPINIDQMGNDEFSKIETEEKHIPKDKTLIASTFISSMLKDMKIGFKDLGQKKITSQNRNERTIPIKCADSEAIKIVSGTDMASKAEIKSKPTLTDNTEKEKNIEEKKMLFESLKKDQQRIQEEFRRREELKIKEVKETEAKRNLFQAQNKLQNDSQHWHEQLQRKQDFNKSIEKKVQNQLNYQDNLQNKKVLSCETTQQKNYLDQSYQNFKDKDKLNKEMGSVANKKYKEVQMQENMTNQELHVSELQKQLKIKEELQWQELQKESNIQSQNSNETSLVQEQINKPPNKQDVKVIKRSIDQEEKLKNIKSIEGAKKFDIIKKEEEKRQNELRIRENLLKIEEKKLIEKIISEEERKLLEQKKNIEERLKRQSSDVSNKRLTTASVPVTKPKTSNLPKERPSTLKKSDLLSLEGQTFYINPDQDLCKENDGDEEGTIDDLRKEEEERMKEEAKIYEEYKRHLETKRKGHYDSDDYASEWDTGEEEDDKDKPRGLYLEETFDELKATSEEELYDAQEKSIRNLERQIRKQKQREMRKCYEKRHMTNQLSKRNSKSSSNEASPPQQKKYSSTGDLHSTPSRTRPITKFSPDPMEFGFRPIETPHSIISRSVGNLMSGGGPSASSIAHVAGAEAGVAAIKKPICKKFYYPEEKSSKEKWNNRYRISSSLEDLQQVSRKPPLPIQAKLKASTLRHATSEETIVKYDRPCEDPRRHTYTEGEDFSELAYLDTLELEPSDYGNLLNEYYAAYYDTYYQSYYRVK